MGTQQLMYQASRWPWKWFKFARDAAALCHVEAEKFNVLKTEHHFLKIDSNEQRQQRMADAEKHQQLRDDFQLLKLEMAELQRQRIADLEREKRLTLEMDALREERSALITKHDQMKSGVTTLFEFIRRNKVTDDRGNNIPEMGAFPNVFRK